MKIKPILLAAFVLSAFAVSGVALVVITQTVMADRIAENQRQAMERKLAAILPAGESDNDPLTDTIEVSARELLGADTTRVYRVRKGEAPVAVILEPVVPDGYAGPIRLLVSVLTDGSVGGVRVLSHHETPGLGDKIEEAKSDWVYDFAGTSLGDPPLERWAVKRDGGDFDQFTGATITPRAIVKAVKNTLIYVEQQGERLYEQPATQTATRRTTTDQEAS
ncbi:electron transport complex subunit RsxG [Marichromatium bheemlicum]|uniref:Ion-translocating oxidoreductase complex subunit G n=1 Tax=Marichromatium bheemlicum TaxID=365339 RepID=A0ABX1I3Q1_9GAMM|nr:electron transport complex subunit RsxG [Marichromatium bheemlicum]NKN32120.1 electron transport complex subunit RsxG [Marichromatium bheemlicum]